RAVSSILVIAEFTIPLLAVFALKEIFSKPEILKLKENRTGVIVTLVLTAGVTLILAVAPGVFFSGFITTQEMAALQQGLPAEHLTPVVTNLTEMREAIIASDAWRSFFIIIVGCFLLFLYQQKKLKATFALAGIALLCLIDMWTVNKRYLHDDLFVPKSKQAEAFVKTQADEIILQDTTLDYRVLNFVGFPGNTFNENNTAYWHKSVGGYHAAKLRRYQEMIDHHIVPEMQATYQAVATAGGEMDSVDASKFRVLNMLNTKYFIFPAGQQGQPVPVENPYAYGNAWFVDKVQYVNNANEEIDALNDILPTETAIVDAKFKEQLKGVTEGYKDSLSTVRLTSYEPNRLIYKTSSPKDGVVVFSEIYYPGWQATIDGQPVDIARADYILRAMNVPGGEHTIEMWFDPQSIHVTESIAYAALALLLIGVMVLLWMERRKVTEKPEMK
ncbi:YfhO family protein, partial [uncultured Bacteroides sp.]|uniref:YfhO family protein n=1 Tax=uncultured Bacteroides sp. TaxID=162156 RepID=UPI00280BC945